MPLPEDTGLRGNGQPKVRRFRSCQIELGERLCAFRERYGVKQGEVARAVGAGDHSAVSQWESGVNVPKGVLRERLVELVEGQQWPELRAAMLDGAGDGVPGPWNRAVRWYRRASREQRSRATVGAAVSAILDELRDVAAAGDLRRHYCEHDGEWAPSVVARGTTGDGQPADLRRAEDAAYGLRWLELAHGRRLDPGRSLVLQLPPALLDGTSGTR